MNHLYFKAMTLVLFPLSIQGKVVSKDLGMVSDTQTVAGVELKKLMNQTPDSSIYRITLKEKLGGALDSTTIIYVSGEKKLGRYTKTEMPGDSAVFWRVWSNIEPHHFQNGLPYKMKSISDTTKPGPFPLAQYLE